MSPLAPPPAAPRGPSRLGPILALAAKDLRLLVRNRGALFFALAWPVMMALFFGLIFGGGGERGRIEVAAVDEDATPASAALLARLGAADGVALTALPRAEAEAEVRAGKRTAAVVVPRGYGEAEARLFRGVPRRIELLVDPARPAEAAMLEGILTGAAMASLQGLFEGGDASRRLVDGAMGDLDGLPAGPRRDATGRFLGELRQFLGTVPAASPATAGGPTTGGLTLVQIDRRALRADHPGPRSAFEVTFPQGILWGVIGCALGFALSLVQERTRGTLVRLRASPLAPRDVLLGKGLACLVAILAVEALLLGLGWAAFDVRPASWGLLAAAAISLAACFVGIMMLVAVLGKTEQSASGLGWAAMMPLAMLGGGMVPLFAMPAWMQAAGVISPVRWGILALEGAIWRGFGPAELALPCAVLWAVGVAGFTIGAWRYGASAGDVGG